MKWLRWVPLFVLPLLLGTGCAAQSEEETGDDTGAATTGNPDYDAVIANGSKVDTISTPTAQQSASTHLLGFIPGVTPATSAKQLLSVAKWPDIRDANGGQPFTAASVTSDVGGSGEARKLAVKLTLTGGVELEVNVTANEQDGGVTVRIVNTSAYKVLVIGTVLEPGKLVMQLKLLPYKDGTIVDASTLVKLAKLEDRAPPLTASIAAIFDWLKTTAR